MSIWIEIHCDVRAPTSKEWYAKHLKSFCQSEAGDQPGLLFRTTGPVASKMAVLSKHARELGWTKSRKHGWVCANCKTTLPD